MQKTGLVPVILLVLLAINLSNAQSSRAAHWYFGIQAGLNFMSGTAVADTTSQIASIEGSAAMSDSIGNLLFYAGGDKVWNKNGILMANSNGMLGDVSSAQSGIIVPKPGSNSLYYLFNTIPYSLNGGLYYNVIDMSLNNGLGDINASKNILLFSSCSEEIAATRHCNAMDYWIVSRETTNGSLKFYAYRLSSTGLSAPVISTFPLAISDWAAVGGLTFSQNGNLLIHNATGAGSIQVLNFDKQTGQLTQQTQVSVYPNEQVYSNALSANASKLYITSWSITSGLCYLSQFDLSSQNIAASRKNLDSADYSLGSPNGFGFLGAVRLAPDQKIYVSRWNQRPPFLSYTNWGYSLDSLGVINAPDLTAPSCNYQQNGFDLNKRVTMLGLPNFVSNFTSDQVVVNTCPDINIGLENDNSFNNFLLTVSPNPFSDKTNLFFNRNDKHNISIELIDILGKTHHPVFTENPEDFELQRGALPSGIYFLSLHNGKELLAEKKLIVR